MMGGTLDDKTKINPHFSVWCSAGSECLKALAAFRITRKVRLAGRTSQVDVTSHDDTLTHVHLAVSQSGQRRTQQRRKSSQPQEVGGRDGRPNHARARARVKHLAGARHQSLRDAFTELN